MKLKDFLQQFEGLDSEIEVGIINSRGHFIDDIEIDRLKVKKDRYHNTVFTMDNHSKEVILIF